MMISTRRQVSCSAPPSPCEAYRLPISGESLNAPKRVFLDGEIRICLKGFDGPKFYIASPRYIFGISSQGL